MKKLLVLAVAFTISVALHLLMVKFDSEAAFHAGLPGMVVSILTTGGHGGTLFEDQIAPFLEIGTNTIFYFLVIWSVTRFIINARGSRATPR
jgi:hypothetical protein